MKPLKMAVIGLKMGNVHVRSLRQLPGVEIAAVVDLDLAHAEKIAADVGARPYAGCEAMLEGEKELDGVILATPARVRREPITAICERGLALFCEKPPALNQAEAREIEAVIARTGILNAVGFMYRWNPLAERMREMIAGRPRLLARSIVAWPVLDWVARGAASPMLRTKAGCGGMLVEQGVHFQDALRYITGDEPIAVSAAGELGTIHPKEGRDCEETIAYCLRHASGMLSTHLHNWSHHGALLELQIVGETFDLTWRIHENPSLYGTVDGKPISLSEKSDDYFREIEGFAEAIRRQDQSLIRSSYADASRSLAVCESIENALARPLMPIEPFS